MHDQTRRKRLFPTRRNRLHRKTVAYSLDAADLRLKLHIDAEFPCLLNQHGHQLGVEALQRTRAAVQHCNLRARARCDVGELEGDVTPSYEYDLGRQLFELEKLGTGDDMFLAGKLEV